MDSQVKKKSKAVKIVYITIISLVLVLISYIGIKKYYKCKEQDKEKNKEIEFYKTEVDKYLYDTYGKNFDIEFKEKKYYITGPATDFAHCEGPVDQNIENFKFTFSSFDSKEVKGYVSALHNITTDEVEIVETNEFNSYERNPELYNEHLKLYYQKKEIESKVKSLAGNDYDVDLYSDANYVILKTKRTFREIISNDVNKFESMFNELKKLVNNKDVKVKIWFSPTERHDALCGTNVSPSYTEGFITTDYSYYYIDAIIQIEKESMEIEKNFNKIKTVVNFGEYGEELIHIYFNTKYDEKFESDIQKYKDIANNKYYKYMEIMLEFKDETITVKSDINYNSINNLSKEIIDKVKSLAGNDYDVSTGTITLKAKRTFSEIVLNDVDKFKAMVKELKKIVNNEYINIEISFNSPKKEDISITPDFDDSCIDAIIQIVKESTENNIVHVNSAGNITIDFQTKYTEEKYASVVEKYRDIANKYQKDIYLSFLGKSINIKSNINSDNINEQKEEIIGKVKSLVGNDYNVCDNVNSPDITLEANKTFREISLNDIDKFKTMIKELKKLVNNKDTNIKISFYSPRKEDIYITTDFDDSFIDAIVQIQKESTENNTVCVSDAGNITIEFYEKYDREKFANIIKKYRDISIKYHENIYLLFTERAVVIG